MNDDLFDIQLLHYRLHEPAKLLYAQPIRAMVAMHMQTLQRKNTATYRRLGHQPQASSGRVGICRDYRIAGAISVEEYGYVAS